MTRCECGRPARFYTRNDRHFRTDKKHGLCGSCFRRMMEAQNVKDRETRREQREDRIHA